MNLDPIIRAVQAKLGVIVDGDAGEQTWKAIYKFVTGSDWVEPEPTLVWKDAEASSFADPADIRAFKRCKETGKTDLQCFAVGDNGIGQFGANTAQEHTPMCALHANDMIARWGSVAKAAHKNVIVSLGGKKVQCAVEDRMSAKGRIDLNPAACKSLGLTPPVKTAVQWAWL